MPLINAPGLSLDQGLVGEQAWGNLAHDSSRRPHDGMIVVVDTTLSPPSDSRT